MAIYIENYSSKEVEELIVTSGKTAIIPIGAIEQHGDHLPIGTDTLVAEGLAKEASEKTGAVVIPSFSFGWSPHHMVRSGTITIRSEVLIELLYDVVSSLAQHGFKNFVMINGHRIVNVIWIQIASQKIQEKYDVEIKLFDPAYMSKDFCKEHNIGPVGHADEIESSHLMYLHEDLVDLSLAVDNPVEPVDLYSVDPAYAHDTLCYIPTPLRKAKKEAAESNGVTGTPSKSTKEMGANYHRHLMNHLVKVIEKLQREVEQSDTI